MLLRYFPDAKDKYCLTLINAFSTRSGYKIINYTQHTEPGQGLLSFGRTETLIYRFIVSPVPFSLNYK